MTTIEEPEKELVYDSWLKPFCSNIREVVEFEKKSQLCMEELVEGFLKLQQADKRVEVTGSFKSFGVFLIDRMPVTDNRQFTNIHMQRAIRYLNEHLAEHYSLTKLADYAGMSTAGMCRLFRAETTLSVSGYLLTMRMRKAIELLGSTELMVVEIADLCGYCCPSHFITVFKSYTGKTPMVYKMDYKSRVSALI